MHANRVAIVSFAACYGSPWLWSIAVLRTQETTLRVS